MNQNDIIKSYIQSISEDELCSYLKLSASAGYLENLKIIFEIDFIKQNLQQFANDILVEASIMGHLEVIKFAIENGADIHYDNDIALYFNVNTDRIDVIEYILSQNPNINLNNSNGVFSL